MINLDTVSGLVRAVDVFIDVRKLSKQLDIDLINKLLKDASLALGIPCSDDELDAARRDLSAKYCIKSTPGNSIQLDYNSPRWYDDAKADIVPTFWTRYRNYLIDVKHFSPNVVSTLGDDTLDRNLMNYILDPNADYKEPVLHRGLMIGDVQSGKTSTYIGFMCKAADAGYKVFILLTGTIESLRRQTQERVEEGFIGIDLSSGNSGGKRVGVGLDNQPIRAAAFTSRHNDFTGNSNKIAMALSDNAAVVFVIKKQKNVLTKLKNWLTKLNADPTTGKINKPMIMIDDEADNASINTSKDKEDPTTINRLIRELANVFTVSNYVGFTATPFANVFIDPETPEKMETQDLFPEDFIMALPTPTNYIGPNEIFNKEGKYFSQLNYISDAGYEEEDGQTFWFKHKKEWEGELPESLTDAIYTFYLANAIRDLRGDKKQHRSMLINITRFIRVQSYVKKKVEKIHAEAYSAMKFHLSQNFNESMKNPILRRIYENWQKQYEGKVEFGWNDISRVLFQSVENLQIKVVNSKKSSEKLDYPDNESMRVIAIGGLALSRGLTLEGLIVSYFYRNTCTYDVLMQMGRWFGYRKNYEDLFRIWIHKSSADWYAEIAEATDRLKADMQTMRDRELHPRDFGIRVRNNSDDLNITANNKMRNASDELDYLSYFGGIVETPYLCLDTGIEKANFEATTEFVQSLIDRGYPFERQKVTTGKGHFLIQRIPKTLMSEYIRKLKISKFSTEFNTSQIADFIDETNDPSIAEFDLAFMEGDGRDTDSFVKIAGREIPEVRRTHCVISSENERIGIGRRGKLGGPTDGRTGIVDTSGMTAAEIIEAAEADFRNDYRIRNNGEEFGNRSDGKKNTYPSDTWFRYVTKRRPILLVYLIDIRVADDEKNQKLTIEKFRNQMNGIPVTGFALGFPKNNNAAKSFVKYKVNRTYNYYGLPEDDQEGVEE